MKPTPDETLRALRDSLDADVLRDDYPIEMVEAELREAGCEPADLIARCRPIIDELLAKRRAAWRERSRARLEQRGVAPQRSEVKP